MLLIAECQSNVYKALDLGFIPAFTKMDQETVQLPVHLWWAHSIAIGHTFATWLRFTDTMFSEYWWNPALKSSRNNTSPTEHNTFISPCVFVTL